MLIKGKPAFVYDVEIFPNFFSVTCKNTESKNHVAYEISDRRNDIAEIARLFLNRRIYFVGYNSMHYDKPIISYILINYKKLISIPVWQINAELKRFSDLIINSDTSAPWSKYKYANLYDDLDLLTMKWSDKLRPSLKALQVTMLYKNVEEYAGDFNLYLSQDKFDSVLSYNLNDVESTEEFLYRCKKDIDLRIAIQEEYGIDVMNKDGVNLGMEILKDRYLKETGLSWNAIKDLRSPCNIIAFKDIIFPCISFKTKYMQDFFERIKNTVINLEEESKKSDDSKFHITFLLGGVEHNFSLGGMHSVNTPERFEPNEDECLRDWDVTSMYPSIIIEWGLYPKHLGPEFLKVYGDIKAERVIAKKNGDRVKNETLKLALNGLSGNLQSKFSWVYSPESVLTLRINGQLMILMLAEAFVEAGAQIINTNTDGIFVLHKQKDYAKLLDICKWWESVTKIGLEEDTFERFYQYAVNDYIGVKSGYSQKKQDFLNGCAVNKKGEKYESLDAIWKDYIKKKGLFIDEPQLGKGLAPLIIPEAINKYFVEGIDPEDTIKDCTDILKFCTFQKVAKDFHVEYGGKEVRHINRYYMSTNGQRLIKYKLENDVKVRPTNMCADSGVTLYNKFDDISISERHINYRYYLNEVYKIITPLNSQQLSLWS